MVWTQFWDMHSGGGLKEDPYHYIYIEAPIDEAKVIFYNKFEHNPERVSCTCCGEDYAISEYKTLGEATDYHRIKKTVEEYTKDKDVLVIRKKDIKDDERTGEVPEQGYVWR